MELDEQQRAALARLGAWATSFAEITERGAEAGTPDTMLDEVRTVTEQHLAGISKDGAKHLFEALFDQLARDETRRSYVDSFRDHARDLCVQARRDPMGAALFDQLIALEQGAIGAALVVVGAEHDPANMGREIVRPAHYLRALADAPNDEAVAMHLIDLVRLVAEPAYARYARILVRLEAAARGDLAPKIPTALGNLIPRAAASFPGRVEADLAHIRNAGAHGSWRYDVKAEQVVITDRKWGTHGYDLDDFGEIAFKAFRVSGPTLLAVLNAYALRALADSGAWEGLASALARLREPDATARIEEAQGRLWKPIRRRWALR
jgi:hypothetical protein